MIACWLLITLWSREYEQSFSFYDVHCVLLALYTPPTKVFKHWDLSLHKYIIPHFSIATKKTLSIFKALCYQKLFQPFTVWINCSSDLKNLKIWKFSAFSLEFQKFFWSLEKFFLTVGQNKYVDFHIFSKPFLNLKYGWQGNPFKLFIYAYNFCTLVLQTGYSVHGDEG